MITSRTMNRRRLEILAVALISLLTIICWETTARLFWKNAPAIILPFNDDIFMKVGDGDVYYALKPGERFYYQGAAGFINRKGLRGAEVTLPKPEKVFRVAVVGDEVVFGPGLREDDLLTARLQEELSGVAPAGKTVEVINAGTPGYDFLQSAAFARRLGALEPDLVLLVISEDDFEIQGVSGEDGRAPSAIAAKSKNSGGLLKGIGAFMLPDKEARFRYFLANASKGYLMAALYLKGAHGADYVGVPADIRNKKYDSMGSAYPASSSSCQADSALWSRVDKALEDVSDAATAGRFKVAGVIYSDFSIRGREAIRIMDSFDRAGVPLLNLSVYRKNEDTEKKNHALGWIDYPNSPANVENAKNLATAMREMNLLKGFKPAPEDNKGGHEKLLAVRKNMYWELVNGQTVRDRIATNDFTDVVDFSSPGTYKEGQVLYGWWPPVEFAWMGRPELAWGSRSAAVIIKKSRTADALHVEGGAYPPGSDAKGGLRVSFGFECMKPDTEYVVRGSYFQVDVPLPPELLMRDYIEVSVNAENPFTPAEAGGGEGDERLVSLGVKSMKFVKMEKVVEK